MKILHIIGFFQPEMGYEEYYLAKQQAFNGHEVFVLTSDKIWPFPHLGKKERMRPGGTYFLDGFTLIREKSLFSFRDYIIFSGVIKQIRRIRPDVIHIHEPRQGIYGFLAVLFSSKMTRKVVDVHEYQLSPGIHNKLEYYVLRYLPIRTCLFGANTVLAMTPKTITFVKKVFKYDKCKLIPLGADHSLFYYDDSARKAIRNDLGITDEECVIIFSGKVTPSKGIEQIIKQISNLARRFPVKLLIVGSGSARYIDKICKLVEEAALVERAIVLPAATPGELYQFFSAADLGYWPLSPTISILEALACGLPVLVGNSDITGHIVNELVGGVISSNNSEPQLVNAVIKWRAGFYKRDKIRAYFMANFSYHAISKRIETIYENF